MTIRVMVTGHRKLKKPKIVRPQIRGILGGLKSRYPDIHAISGMALGADMIFAEESLDLGIPLIAALPYPDQTARWGGDQVLRWRSILDRSCQVVQVSEEEEYKAFSIGSQLFMRNLWMLDHSDILIAVWGGQTTGGTWNTIKEARRRHRRILILNPMSGSIHVEKPGASILDLFK